MNTLIKMIFVSLSILLFTTLSIAAKATNPTANASAVVPLDTIIAVVNKQVITAQELKQAIVLAKEQMAAAQIPFPNAATLQRQVLNEMINRTLELEYAKKLNIHVSDDQLNQAILTVAKNNHMSLDQLRQSVIARGMSYPEYRQQIREQILISQLQQRVIAPQVTVTDQEVKAFLQNYSQQSHPDTEYHVYDILIPLNNSPSSQEIAAAQKRAQQLINQLQQGANFQQLAAANSAGNEALQGGDLGWRKLAELPTVFANQITAMHLGQVGDPIRAGNGFHILKLVDVRNSAKKLTLDQIRQFIFERKFTEQLEAWIQQLRDSSYVKILLQ